MDLDQYRQASHAIWEAMTQGWEDRRDWVWEASRPVGEWLVDRLDPGPGQTILEVAAGFREIHVEEIEMAWTFDGFDDYWGYLTGLAGALAMVIKDLPPEEKEAIRTEVGRGLAQYERDGRYAIGGVCVNAVAS